MTPGQATAAARQQQQRQYPGLQNAGCVKQQKTALKPTNVLASRLLYA
jgi:hypothetical protein